MLDLVQSPLTGKYYLVRYGKNEKILEKVDIDEGFRKTFIERSKIEENIEKLEGVIDLCIEDNITKYNKLKLLEEIEDFKELLESEE